ncbi:MAG: response regulator transcription factor [Prevotella sp.]|nr:response regulator transcription factor [Prevotella sp.]
MKKKILILDDKETIAKVLSIYLMSDYDVQWLPDGLQAVKWLQEGNTPDLIISDIRMPEMRGDDFLEWIKQNELFRHIPVIMLSSEDSTSERIRLLEIGAEDYIVKPFNPIELKIRVKKILPN